MIGHLDSGPVGGSSVEDVYGSVEEARHVAAVHVLARYGAAAPHSASLARLVLGTGQDHPVATFFHRSFHKKLKGIGEMLDKGFPENRNFTIKGKKIEMEYNEV